MTFPTLAQAVALSTAGWNARDKRRGTVWELHRTKWGRTSEVTWGRRAEVLAARRRYNKAGGIYRVKRAH